MANGRPLAAALGLALAGSAQGFDPFEIQVYGPDIGDPGQPSVEFHFNVAWGGSTTPEYPGQIPPGQAIHYPLEPAIGVLEWLELGAYVQAISAPGYGLQGAGWKLRAKGVVPRRFTGDFFAGLNVEVGAFPTSIEPDSWATEIRPIVGWSGDWLYVSLNPIFGFSLAGADAFRVVLAPALKVQANTQLGFGVGVEYYTTMGFLNALPAPSGWEQILFAVVDLLPPAGARESDWELNLGVGRALTEATPQRWSVKAIIGRSF
jgi:hypothetical protein